MNISGYLQGFASKRPLIALSLVALALAAIGVPANAQTDTSLDRGLAAAQRQDYKAAVGNFLDARKLSPDAPQILFDLGLAESHLDGWELRSTAWFKLYLTAVPQATNADAVRQQIADLETSYETRITSVIDRLERILATCKAIHQTRQYSPQPNFNLSAGQVREAVAKVDMWSGWDLAGARLTIGDVPGAMASFKRLDGSGWRHDWDKARQEDISRNETVGSPSEPGRESFLLDVALNGIKLNNQFDETQMADYMRSYFGDDQCTFLGSPTSMIHQLALSYRKVRGPTREQAKR